MAFPTGYTKYQIVTVDNTKVPGDLTDYPIYIDMSQMDKTTDIFDTCRTDGGDIRVTKSDGTTQLAREVVAIDTTGKTGTLHVKLDGTLSSSSDTDIWVWYNGTDTEPSASSTYGSENVWDDYSTVLHLQESVNTITDGYGDAAGNNPGTGRSMTQAARTGKMPDTVAQSAIAGNDGVKIPWNATAGEETQPDPMTYSMWVYADAVTTYSACISSEPGSLWFVLQRSGGLWKGASTSSGVAYNAGEWYLVSGTYASSITTTTMAANGTRGTNSSSTLTKSTDDDDTDLMYFQQNTTHSTDGGFQEFRIRNSVVDNNWEVTEYNNQNSPSTFISVSTEQEAAVTGNANFLALMM